MSNKMPRLIIGGASKSGTTAVYYYLRQHPSICLSEKKELHFFSRSFLGRTLSGPGDRYVFAEIPKTFAAYQSFFRHCGGGKVAVDISPSYLFYFGAAAEMKRLLGQVGIVFILRNPVEKAFSQYLHLVSAGRETTSFEEALALESARQAQGFADMWLYKTSGYYAPALQHYLDVMGSENVKIFYYEEFLNDHARVLRDICAFAAVDPSFDFERVTEVNRSGKPKSAVLSKLIGPNPLTWLSRRVVPQGLGRTVRKLVKDLNTGNKPVLDSGIREMLLDSYRADICHVEELVGRSSGWLR